MKSQKNELLTKREMECLFWISKGYIAKEIAREMHISLRTVEGYVKIIRNKTNLYRRSQMIAFFNEMYGLKFLNLNKEHVILCD